MHITKTQTLLLLSIIFFLLTPLQAKNEWKLGKQGKGINVYVRDTPGSLLKSFRGEVLIKTHLIPLVAILEDPSSFPRWMHQTKSAQMLKEINQTSSYVHVVTDMPWPVVDRDSVTLAQLTQDKQSKQIQITLESTPDYIKPKPDHLRIREMQGKWIFMPQEKGLSKVIYEMRVDPGGNLPKWLVNALSVDMPFYTLDNLRREVMAAKYQNAQRSYIQE